MKILKFNEFDEVNEALPRQQSVDQLKKVMKFSAKTDLNVIHVWQEDNGFQKTKILNTLIKSLV